MAIDILENINREGFILKKGEAVYYLTDKYNKFVGNMDIKDNCIITFIEPLNYGGDFFMLMLNALLDTEFEELLMQQPFSFPDFLDLNAREAFSVQSYRNGVRYPLSEDADYISIRKGKKPIYSNKEFKCR